MITSVSNNRQSESQAAAHVTQASSEQMVMADWKSYIGNGELINNSSEAVRVWSSDAGTYTIAAHSRSESWGEDVDHVEDIHGQWWKIGWNTAVVDSNGEVSGAKCKSPGPGQDCGVLGDFPIPDEDTVQAKLEVNQPNDRFEQEADAVAENVMAGEKTIQRKCAHCEEEEKLQRQISPEEEEEEILMKAKPMASATSVSSGIHVKPWVQKQIDSSRGSGRQLSEQTRSYMESGIGADFQNVRIHTDSEAVQMNRELSARAFTVGSDIYFNSGEYSPESSDGKRLLAHELTHTVQQGMSERVQRTIGDGHDLSNPRFSHDTKLESAFDNESAVAVGSCGESVRLVQEALMDMSFDLPKFGADCDFGSETQTAVAQFQQAHNAMVDGAVGPQTMGLMDEKAPQAEKPTPKCTPCTPSPKPTTECVDPMTGASISCNVMVGSKFPQNGSHLSPSECSEDSDCGPGVRCIDNQCEGQKIPYWGKV